MKLGNKCEKISPKTDFYRNKKMSDGLYNQCKSCRKEYYNEN